MTNMICNSPLRQIFAVLTLSALTLATPVQADISQRADVQAFFREMQSEHGFNAQELEQWFSRAQIDQDIIDRISKPAERTLEWKDYRQIFIKENRIQAGKAFFEEHKETLRKAEARYGVPAQVIAAIIGVETFYGKWKGKHDVLTALSTLAFAYPPRSKFFRSELESFLLMAREQKLDPVEMKGSYAGAMGYGQFIPSSYRAYAVDFDEDGQADIITNLNDAIGSVANYLARHGWEPDHSITWPVKPAGTPAEALLPRKQKPQHTLGDFGALDIETLDLPPETPARLMRFEGAEGPEYWVGLQNFYAITRYNHSDMYALAVFQLSEAIAAP